MTSSDRRLNSSVSEGAQWKEAYSNPLVWDNHSCMPIRPNDLSFMPQLARVRDSGVDLVVLNIGYGEVPWQDHIKTLAAFRAWLADHSDKYRIVGTIEELDAARRDGVLAIAFDIEGAAAIDDQIALVQLYYELGVRWMLIAYNKPNRLGGGCHQEDRGLTAFGRDVVREMERVGMLVCCTHTGWKTARDVLDLARQPVIFSHSNAHAVHAHPRNIPDDLIRGCAETGGVIGVNGIGIFLGEGDPIERIYAHIDHIVSTVGYEHVGLGLDYVFDQRELDDALAKMRATFPAGHGYEAGIKLVGPESIRGIADRLCSAGYSMDAVTAILGGNFRRVAAATWR